MKYFAKECLAFCYQYAVSLFLTLYLFTLGIFSPRHRAYLAEISNHFPAVSKFFGPKPLIPEVDLSILAPDDAALNIREPLADAGNISLLELIVLIRLVKKYRPQKIFEIGTFDGRTALNLACNSPDECIVYTLDLPREKIFTTKLPLLHGDRKYIDKKNPGLKFLGTDCERKIIQLHGDSADFDFSPFLGAMDLVFVDGSHSYEYVLHDASVALKLLRNSKGIIVFHDYNHCWRSVMRALNKLYQESKDFRDLVRVKETSLVCLILE